MQFSYCYYLQQGGESVLSEVRSEDGDEPSVASSDVLVTSNPSVKS